MNKGKLDLNRTRERLRALGLPHAAEQLEGVLSDTDNTSCHQALDALLDTEISVREAPRIKTSPATEEGSNICLLVGLVLASLFLITLGSLLEHHWRQKFWAHISNEIGIAFLVAFILAVTIERVLKKRDDARFSREKEAIKRDVFEHVLGYRLRPGTFKELDNQILNARFIREDFEVTYTLSPLSKEQEFVLIEGEISYKVVNMTPERQLFEFRTSIEEAPVERLKPFVKFIAVTIIREASPPDPSENWVTPEAIKAGQDKNPPPNHLVIKKQIAIQGDRHVSVTSRFNIVRALHGGSSFILTPLQALGLDLKVKARKAVEVLATAYLPETLSTGDGHLPEHNIYHWVLKRPMLPNQGVYLTWKSKAGADRENRADGVEM
jgi:hypothetical protein